MGCSFSETAIRNLPGKQIYDYLTEEEVRLVKNSWNIVGKDIEDAGITIFRKLFAMQEGLKKLFTNLMIKSTDDKVIFDDDKLRNHAKIVMEGLGAAVESLEDSIFLTNVLIAMGERHAAYNVKPEMVLYLWPAIRDTFKEKLGEDFSPEVERAWTHVFEYIASKFQEGVRKGKHSAREN